jgi:hypothetical protein
MVLLDSNTKKEIMIELSEIEKALGANDDLETEEGDLEEFCENLANLENGSQDLGGGAWG